MRLLQLAHIVRQLCDRLANITVEPVGKPDEACAREAQDGTDDNDGIAHQLLQLPGQVVCCLGHFRVNDRERNHVGGVWHRHECVEPDFAPVGKIEIACNATLGKHTLLLSDHPFLVDVIPAASGGVDPGNVVPRQSSLQGLVHHCHPVVVPHQHIPSLVQIRA